MADVVGVLVAAGVEELEELAEDDADDVELELDVDVVPDFVVLVVVGGVAAPTVGTVSGGAPVVPVFGEAPPPQAASEADTASAAAAATALVRARLSPPLPVIGDGMR